eukprot:TRINITY_DN1212_c0_g2_i1.p1 TRINITY_DN1212_c0_g2~~TRINITY_DN1212_c0_g2_i1.p1  ORF type:complete len:205 (-),score=48.20 TRINITY_DN1212_c0_g2_i1:26-640(-)
MSRFLNFLKAGVEVFQRDLPQQMKAAGLTIPVNQKTMRGLSAGPEEDYGFENTTIGDILAAKPKGEEGDWLFCMTKDTVYDAVAKMVSHNVGALLVLNDSDKIAGIVTERDYLRKMIVQGRSSKDTTVGDIMTEENKLVTVTPTTRVIQAMELMTDNRIRHVPVVEGKKMLGMLSIKDVVAAVVGEHRDEVKRLSDYIRGNYDI